jgi:hypothetical protein
MDELVEITIVLDKRDAEKLIDLAGNEEHLAQYLTTLIRKLHTDQRVVAGDLRLEQLVSEADSLIKNHKEYKQTIGALKRRLTEMTMNQEELMATVQYLDKNLLLSTRNAAPRRKDEH